MVRCGMSVASVMLKFELRMKSAASMFWAVSSVSFDSISERIGESSKMKMLMPSY